MTGLIALSDLRATQQISCKGCGQQWDVTGAPRTASLCPEGGLSNLCSADSLEPCAQSPNHGLEPAVSCSLLASNFAFHCSLPAEEVLVSCSSCPASNIVTFLCTKAVSLLQNWSDFFFLKITNPFDIFLS